MINEEMIKKINVLFENEDFACKFFDTEDWTEMKSMLVENGVEISDGEFKSLLQSMLVAAEHKNGDELNEEEMENVSGGIIGWLILGGAGAIIGGVATHQLRRVLNSMSGVCD